MEIPECVQALWSTFVQLSATRRTGMGPSAITLTDIEAWCRLSGVRLSPWELDTLLAVDAAMLKSATEAKHEPE